MKQNIYKWLILALGVFLLGQAYGQNYVIDTKASKLEWVAKKLLGQHNGTVNIKAGNISNLGGKFAGKVELDMNTIVDLDLTDPKFNAKLTNHLKSEDFFHVENFPTSIFEVTEIKPLGQVAKDGATHEVLGKLTIKGIVNPINFPATITKTDKMFTAKAEFTIDRTKWNVRYRSSKFFPDIGDKIIDDRIWYKFDITAQASKSGNP